MARVYCREHGNAWQLERDRMLGNMATYNWEHDIGDAHENMLYDTRNMDIISLMYKVHKA